MLVKPGVDGTVVDSLLNNILLGKPLPENLRLSELNAKQIEYIKNQCYQNISSMLSKMRLLDEYLKDKIRSGE